MFTGLIEEIGEIKSIYLSGAGRKITIRAHKIMDDLKIDDSVSINGVCQTAVSVAKDSFEVDAVEETIRKTTFGSLRAGQRVNLERALTLSTRLGGHIVQGHTDTTGVVISINSEQNGILMWVQYPDEFSKYIVSSGSICINGVSLTTARVDGNRFMVSIIPHSWKMTTLADLKSGDKVNLEFDILGKYIEKMLIQNENMQNSSANKPNWLDQFIDQPKL